MEMFRNYKVLCQYILVAFFSFIWQFSFATIYYVNDTETVADIYCTEPGDDVSHDGLTPATPLESLSSVIAMHGPSGTGTISSGDIFYIDAGTYYQTDANLGINLNNISIIGAGSEWTVFDNDGASSDANRWANLTGDNVLIQGLFITGYNYGVGDAIALQIDGATNFTINDVKVNENLPGGGSSAIFITGSSTGTFNGGGASCNPPNPSIAGGGVNVEGNGNVISFNNFDLSNNSKDVQGGAGMRIDGNATTSITITNSLFEGNKTDGAEGGGAILILNGAQLNISGTCFNNNNASQASSVNYGGAINVGEGADVTISHCSFNGNFASSSGNGGAISINSSTGSSGGTPTITIDTCTFMNNSATDGNDIFTRGSNGGVVTAFECTWSNTVSEELHIDGGSITIENSSSPTQTGGVTFTNTVAATATPSTVCPASGAPCFAVSLPVEMIGFEGACLNGTTNVISWSTASENNSDYFIVEKSETGISWQDVVKINGAGTSWVRNDYSVEVNEAKSCYYRLKQVDIDGRQNYFPVFFVEKMCSEFTGVKSVHYDALTDLLSLFYSVERAQNVSINFIDAMGREIAQYNMELDPNKSQMKIQLSEKLGNGIYFLSVRNLNIAFNTKIYIQK